MAACVSENINILRNLLNRCGLDDKAQIRMANDRVSLNDPHFPGYTPLHFCALTGHLEIAELLIEKGASSTALNKRGETPADLADPVRHHFFRDVVNAAVLNNSGFLKMI